MSAAPTRVVILAGFRRSLPPVILLNALAERSDVEVAAVLCVNEYSLARIRAWRKRFGGQFWSKVFSVFRRGGGGAFDHERRLLSERVGKQQGSSSQLPARCTELGVPFERVSALNAPDALASVRGHRPDFLIYAGGGILRRRLIELAPRGVLNVHSGPLPHVKGMSGPEWSLFLGLRPTATVHYIDTGIDTGGLLADVSVDVSTQDTLGAIRARTLLAGLDLLVEQLGALAAGTAKSNENPAGRGRQYHEMSPTLKRVVQDWVARGITPLSSHRDVDPDDDANALVRRARHADAR